MTDWADDLADSFIRGIREGTTNQNIIALRLRALRDEAHTEAIKSATAQLDAAFARQGIAGGDK